MKLIIKQIIVMIITFLIILWFQNNDDNKQNKVRDTIYDKYKFPLLVTTIIGLIFNFSSFFKTDCLIDNNIEIELPIQTNLKDNINKLQISTDLPDF